MEAELHAFLTSALDGGEWSALRLGHKAPEKELSVSILVTGGLSRSGSGTTKERIGIQDHSAVDSHKAP